MRILKRVALIALLGGLGVWVWVLTHPSPEKIIRKRFADLARDISFSTKDTGFWRMAGAQKAGDYFAEDVKVVVNVTGEHGRLEGRNEIKADAVYLRKELSALEVQFLDPNVTVGADKTSAQVELTAKVTSPDLDLIVQELKCLLKKTNGQWLITRVETVKVLE